MKLIDRLIIIGILLNIIVYTVIFGNNFIVSSSKGDSMCPALHSKAIGLEKIIDLDDEFIIGNIYTFKGEGYGFVNKYIKHRLINITDDGFLFRGDSNDYADLIKREDIVYKHLFEIPYGWC